MSTDTDTPKPGVREDGLVNCLLAHPLNPSDLVALGLDKDTPANVNDVITVDVWKAQGLIGAGMVQVDPEDNDAVTAYLHATVAPTEGVSAASGTGEDPQVIDTNPGENKREDADTGPYADLKGADLDKALNDRDLSTSGTVAEKRARLGAYVANPVAVEGTEGTGA